jgi:hypothetical protein
VGEWKATKPANSECTQNLGNSDGYAGVLAAAQTEKTEAIRAGARSLLE